FRACGHWRFHWEKLRDGHTAGVTADKRSHSGSSSRAAGAGAPVDDLRLLDHEAVIDQSGETRGLSDGAVDVGDRAARAAHDVVVVVAHPRLIARHRPRGLDPA